MKIITLLIIISFNSLAADLPDYDLKKEKKKLDISRARSVSRLISDLNVITSGNVKRTTRYRN